jgi:hypothetical protein
LKPSRLFPSRRLIALVILVCIILGLAIPLAHAATYIGYTNSNNNQGCATGTQINCSASPTSQHGIGTVILNPLTGNAAVLISVSLSLGSGTGTNKVVIATFPGGTNPTINQNVGCANSGGGSVCSHVANGQTFTIVDVEALSGLTSSAAAGGSFQTIILANPQTIAANQWVAVTFMSTVNVDDWIDQCDTNCSSPPGTSYAAVDMNYATVTPINGGTGTTAGGGFTWIVGATFQPVGASSGQTAITQCYGNCGTPAVTLANTNSTHAFNFNQTVTFFYEFQSNVNGFALNVSTSVAKSYSNQILSLGIYGIASCPQGTTPFSGACPGLLLQGKAVAGNPLVKGRQSMTFGPGQIAVSNGEWIGIAVTATFSGLDLNDTNTNVALFQTQGAIPPTITTATQTSCACKMGLWAFLNGNIVTGTPVQTPTSGCQTVATLDCWVPALVNGSCSNVTPQCQTSAALFWILMLSIIFESLMLWMGNKIMPGMRLPVGEMFIFFFLAFTFVMTGLSLLFLWVPLFFIMLVSVIFSKSTGKYF